MNPDPSLSIVTPSYNQAEFLAETIESVLSQEGDFFVEYIVMDGGSDDGSVEIIRKVETLLNRNERSLRCRGIDFRWESRKDAGQADAVNRGFSVSRGAVLGFINSDDTYAEGAFRKALEGLRSVDADVVYGGAYYMDRLGRATGLYPTEDVYDRPLASRCFICQPALFMKRGVYEAVGPFNEKAVNSFDYEYWLRCARAGFRFKRLPEILASWRIHDRMKSAMNRRDIYFEVFAMFRNMEREIPDEWLRSFVSEMNPGFFTKGLKALAVLSERPFRRHCRRFLMRNMADIAAMERKMYGREDP